MEDGQRTILINGLLKTYIRAATEKVNKPWVRSAFVDNAGIVQFDDQYDLIAECGPAPASLAVGEHAYVLCIGSPIDGGVINTASVSATGSGPDGQPVRREDPGSLTATSSASVSAAPSPDGSVRNANDNTTPSELAFNDARSGSGATPSSRTGGSLILVPVGVVLLVCGLVLLAVRRRRDDA